MKRITVVLVAIVLAGASSATTKGRQADDKLPVVVSGPALGGARVFWGEWTFRRMSILLRSPGAGPQVVYHRGSTPSRQEWSAGDIVASPSLVAFQRAWLDCTVPSKKARDGRAHGPFKVNKGLLPHEIKAEEVGVCGAGGPDARVGRARGPYKPVSKKPYCPGRSGISVDVDADAIAFLETFCRRGALRHRVVVRPFAGGPETQIDNTAGRTTCCGGVRIAGRFVAWREDRSVVVYDLLLRRPAYRARLPRIAYTDFDVQRDGKLVAAVALAQTADGYLPASLHWFSPEKRTGRLLSKRALLSGVRLVDDHVFFERTLGPTSSELVLSDLAGRARRITVSRKGDRRWADFDFDGHAVVWASRKDTSVRRVCPPSPSPCRLVADGVIRIWKAQIGPRTIERAVIAERPYIGLRPAS